MVLSAVLFILLSPGVLLTVTSDKLAPLVTVGSPSNATVIHAIVFAIVLFIVGKGLKASGLMINRSAHAHNHADDAWCVHR